MSSQRHEELMVLESLRAHRKKHREQALQLKSTDHLQIATPRLTLGQHVSDLVARTVGSWRFIIIQSILIVIWMVGNTHFGNQAWDPYPFILLNLILSFQAAYTAPAILMSQNRQEARDRRRAELDYQINLKAELEIRHIQEKLDYLLTKQWQRLSEMQHMQMELMQNKSHI